MKIDLYSIQTRDLKVYNRRAWMGGKTPEKNLIRKNSEFRNLVSAFFREELRDCLGLDFWKCAGTSGMERARIFWNRAKLDAFATLN